MTTNDQNYHNSVRETFTSEEHKVYRTYVNNYLSRINCPLSNDFDQAAFQALHHVLHIRNNK